MRFSILLAAAATGAALAASGAAPAAPSGPPSATAAPVEVIMRGNKFRPRRVVVRLGRAVRWRNRDRAPHTVVSRDNRIASEAIRRGETFTYRPRRRGTVRYFCTIRADQRGVLVVR
jgi:plastocyanin